DDDVHRAHDIEGDDEEREERTYPYREKCQDGEYPCCEVAIRGELSEASGQIGADDSGKDKDQPEEAEAVQSGDGPLRFNPVHCLEPGPEVGAEAKQPRDIA